MYSTSCQLPRKRPMASKHEIAATPVNPQVRPARGYTAFWVCLGMTLTAVLFLFAAPILDGRMTLFFADGNMVQHRGIVDAIRAGGGFFWGLTYSLGAGNNSGAFFYPNWPLLAALPLGLTMWLNIAVHILWAAVGGWFCARTLGIGRWGSAFAGVAFGLTSHFVSLNGAGHLGKLQCIPWIPWTFAFFWKGWESGRIRDFVLCAMCYAPMWLSGEPPLAYFLGLYLGLYSAWRLIVMAAVVRPIPVKVMTGRVALSVLCATVTFLLAWQGMYAHFRFLVEFKPATAGQSINATESQKNDQEYEFATGWSFPPEETAVFVTTGRLFGIKSPVYWGRTGMRDLKLKQVDDYMGVLVVALAFVGMLGVARNRATAFLLLILVTSIVIAWGRFTPVYQLIYHLPTMASQRVPARWIALTAFAFCMLAGIGLERIITLLRSTDNRDRVRLWIVPIVMGLVAIGLLFAALVVGSGSREFADAMFGPRGTWAPSENSALATERARLFVGALAYSGLLMLGASALLAVGAWLARHFNGRPVLDKVMPVWVSVCIGFTALDLSLNNRNYIEFFDWQNFYRADALVSVFQNDPDLYRVQTFGVQQHPYLHRFVTYNAQWHDIKIVDPPAVSRTDPELEGFFDALTTTENYRFNPRYYDLLGIKYVLSSAAVPEPLRNTLGLVPFQQISFQQLPPLYVYRCTNFASVVTFVPNSVSVATDADVLQAMGSTNLDTRSTLVGTGIPAETTASQGSVRIESHDRTFLAATVTTTGRGWVLFKLRHDPDWKAEVDGIPAQVYRVNGPMIGVRIQTAGTHRVRFVYSPSRKHLSITMGAWAAVLAGWVVFGGWAMVQARRRTGHSAPVP